MKRLSFLSGLVAATALIVGCGNPNVEDMTVESQGQAVVGQTMTDEDMKRIMSVDDDSVSTWGGLCCTFKCGNRWFHNTGPTYGQCKNFVDRYYPNCHSERWCPCGHTC